MTEMNDMQSRVDQYISQFKDGYFSPLVQLARLSEEVGELAREINHVYGEKQKKPSEAKKPMEEEIADVLFVLISLSNSLDIDLSEAFDLTMKKFESRDHFRFERKDGQTRSDSTS
ncbi:nucleotide pyrophosphohydrolase [Alkalibacterium sp. 20]|uniref:nucleotide pyrophosphohydrolase n=1 Tax=Alkalibacterium sp. 20 TaxID=1798803 RepID=UPI0008FFEE2E|nr:nucleotide pyrophosphohydrolase [Alkalibacterium sp. 20]OJF90914.1 nucleotide pyrophosphohydrolase [Alkalibacterium sp. 20]